MWRLECSGSRSLSTGASRFFYSRSQKEKRMSQDISVRARTLFRRIKPRTKPLLLLGGTTVAASSLVLWVKRMLETNTFLFDDVEINAPNGDCTVGSLQDANLSLNLTDAIAREICNSVFWSKDGSPSTADPEWPIIVLHIVSHVSGIYIGGGSTPPEGFDGGIDVYRAKLFEKYAPIVVENLMHAVTFASSPAFLRMVGGSQSSLWMTMLWGVMLYCFRGSNFNQWMFFLTVLVNVGEKLKKLVSEEVEEAPYSPLSPAPPQHVLLCPPRDASLVHLICQATVCATL